MQRKHTWQHYTAIISLNLWCQAGWIHAFILFMPNSDLLADRSENWCGLLLIQFAVWSAMLFCTPWCNLELFELLFTYQFKAITPFFSDFKIVFSPRKMPLTGYFLSFRPFSLEMVVWENDILNVLATATPHSRWLELTLFLWCSLDLFSISPVFWIPVYFMGFVFLGFFLGLWLLTGWFTKPNPLCHIISHTL